MTNKILALCIAACTGFMIYAICIGLAFLQTIA